MFFHYAGAQVDGHAGPAPVVDVGTDADERFRVRIGRHAVLLAVGGHRAALDGTGTVLAAHGGTRRLRAVQASQAAQHLRLLVAHSFGCQRGGRLHRRQRQELEYVVLEDVAQDADGVKGAAAAFHAARQARQDGRHLGQDLVHLAHVAVAQGVRQAPQG